MGSLRGGSLLSPRGRDFPSNPPDELKALHLPGTVGCSFIGCGVIEQPASQSINQYNLIDKAVKASKLLENNTSNQCVHFRV